MDKRLMAIIVVAIVAVASVATWWIIRESIPSADIRYGGQHYPGEFLLYGNPGFWDKYGISVEHTLFASGTENNEALVAGKIDINCGSDSKTIQIFNMIPDEALLIGTVQRGDRYTTVVGLDSEGNPLYSSWDEIYVDTVNARDQGNPPPKVATRFGTGAEGVLRKFFNKTGYDWDDFEWQHIQKLEDMITALDEGDIVTFTAWAPTPAIAEAQGVGVAMRSYGDVALVPASIHTTKSFAYTHRDLIVKFLAAHMDKADMIVNNRTGAAQMAAIGAEKMAIDVPAKAFETDFQRINFTIEFDYTIIEEIYATADFLYSIGKIDKIPTLVFDTTFVEAAKEMRETT
jgi:ABC-type nitrate/sulfonate/bicarbonate transport system substrate-binding protein